MYYIPNAAAMATTISRRYIANTIIPNTNPVIAFCLYIINSLGFCLIKRKHFVAIETAISAAGNP